KPSRKGSARSIAPSGVIDTQEDLLAQIRDEIAPPQEMRQESGHRLLPTAQQGCKGRGVPLLPPPDQLLIVHAHSRSRPLHGIKRSAPSNRRIGGGFFDKRRAETRWPGYTGNS